MKERQAIEVSASVGARVLDERVANGSASHRGESFFFVNNVRFVSMFAVVALHCVQVFAILDGPGAFAPIVTTIFKFASIGFFLISGFLMGDRVREGERLSYLKRRLQNVMIPWLLWYGLMVAFEMAELHRDEGLSLGLHGPTFHALGKQMELAMFDTPFWFVPNLFVGLVVLLLLRRYADSLWLGGCLLGANLFYVGNMYREWIPSSHTESMFGYIFYLWLGSYAAAHFERFMAWYRRIPIQVLASAMLGAALLAWFEGRVLTARHSIDPYNTLRLSNQAFSILTVLVLLKLRRGIWPKLVNARRDTFGIYLTHWILLAILMRATRYSLRGFTQSWICRTEGGMLLLWLAMVVASYGASLSITRVLAASRLTRWMVGVVGESKRPQTLSEGVVEGYCAQRVVG